VMERFFLNLTLDGIGQRPYPNHGEAPRDIDRYIVSFYNAVRVHVSLGYLSTATLAAKPTVK
jgi:putative transposase